MMNSVVHFEIPFEDQTRAHTFYGQAFGWQMQSVPEFSYSMVITAQSGDNGMPVKPGTINGGMMKRSEQVKSPVITLEVESIDEALKRVTESGGKIAIGKQQVGDMGFSAYIHDTEGNLIGLWEQQRKPAQVEPQI